MKKATKWVGLLIASAVCASSVAMLTACKEDNPDTTKTVEYTVTYYDGEDILKTEKVKEGEKAQEWTPVKADYTFEGWYATPNFSFEFPFDTPITEDKSVFSQWSSATQSEDTRVYYIVGSGTSPILRASNWGKVFTDDMKMTKAEDKNEYTYTVDLQEGDLFQFALNEEWHNQRGVGYLTSTKLTDGTEAFSGAGTIGDNSAYRLNIKCEYSGNYTFTLTTHPDDDTYETNHPSYTEANKEAFNINTLDTISWVRNGNAAELEAEYESTDYFIKGSGITDWNDFYAPVAKMTNDKGVYTLSVYLKENEEFMFTSRDNFTDGSTSTGTLYLRSTNLDEASKAFVGEKESKNMVAKATGTYTFTYTKATEVLSVAFAADVTPAAADYYIDGTFADGVADWSGYCFNPDFKLTEKTEGSGVYEIKNVAMKADSQIIVQAFKAGATEQGEWGSETYNGLGNYNYLYLYNGGAAFDVVGGGNNNIKVLEEGIYNITFNSYSKIITIESADAAYDVYISGSMEGQTGWNPNYEQQWKFTKSASDKNVYELTIELAVGVQFGLRVFPEGAVADDGQKHTWVGVTAGGTEGVTSAFTSANQYNFECTAAGTYKLTYNAITGVLNIYQANA